MTATAAPAATAGPGGMARRIVETASVPYGDGPRRSLDIYAPRDAAGAPVAVFFYGGSWQGGRKETYRFVGRALARRGIVAVVADYRLYPEVVFPGFVEDGARAVGWTAANIARHGGDPRRIFVMGHSAGAHIAAMIALDGRWLAETGSPVPVAGLLGLSGPYDFLPIRDPALIRAFGGANRPETQPIDHVGPRPPPALPTAWSTRATAAGSRRVSRRPAGRCGSSAIAMSAMR
ncbi:MAG: alpha/beta hydrolase [Rhizobiales bacterium]|nr:alpha/beta hydrolase [Hyphomicrobiales bacterium]